MRFKLVASDLDGTLLRSDQKISDQTRRAVHRSLARAPFVIATGRPPRLVDSIADDLGHHALAVCSNGAITIDLNNDRVIDTRMLSVKAALSAVEAIKSVLPGVSFAVDRLSGLGHDPTYTPRWVMPPGTRIAPVEQLLDEPSLKLLFRHPDLTVDMLDRVIDAVGDHGAITYGATDQAMTALGDVLIEVMAFGVNKASALERICAAQGIAAADVLAFGDMPNDKEMLEWAGHGVAMANGNAAIRASANEVTKSNDDHGVALILDRELGLLPSN
jgi:hydroxymethylpyrimidine pyrophosphatase-like HAD family hydrolase